MLNVLDRYGGSHKVEEMAEFTNALSKHCDAVVVITCHLDPDNEGDASFKANCEKFLSLTPGYVRLQHIFLRQMQVFTGIE